MRCTRPDSTSSTATDAPLTCAAMAAGRRAGVPGAGTRSTSGIPPPEPAATSTRSIPVKSIFCSSSALIASTARGIEAMATRSFERWTCMASRPEVVTAKAVRVRQPSPSGDSVGTASTSMGRSTPARRDSCSAKTSPLRRRCSGRAMCPNSAPPTGARPRAALLSASASGHGWATRCGEGSRTSTASPRQKLAASSCSVSRTRTVSPGSACRTKTTRPSIRATKWPPCAGRSIRASSTGEASKGSGPGVAGCGAGVSDAEVMASTSGSGNSGWHRMTPAARGRWPPSLPERSGGVS